MSAVLKKYSRLLYIAALGVAAVFGFLLIVGNRTPDVVGGRLRDQPGLQVVMDSHFAYAFGVLVLLGLIVAALVGFSANRGMHSIVLGLVPALAAASAWVAFDEKDMPGVLAKGLPLLVCACLVAVVGRGMLIEHRSSSRKATPTPAS